MWVENGSRNCANNWICFVFALFYLTTSRIKRRMPFWETPWIRREKRTAALCSAAGINIWGSSWHQLEWANNIFTLTTPTPQGLTSLQWASGNPIIWWLLNQAQKTSKACLVTLGHSCSVTQEPKANRGSSWFSILLVSAFFDSIMWEKEGSKTPLPSATIFIRL